MRWSNLYRKYVTNPLAYVHNRWINPSDRVIIKHPDYPQGHYHDTDSVMMYVLFQLLVDYIEIECGNFLSTRYETRWQTWGRRVRELPVIHWLVPMPPHALRGLHHLRWEMKLTDHPRQANAAKELFTLYRFWKHVRPARIDPFASYHELRDGKDWKGPITAEESSRLQEASDLEAQYEQEDTDMLQRIVKARSGMWT
jgi:hypothetical protein